MPAWTYTYNGLTFGDGTNIDVVSSEGLEDLPPLRSNDIGRSGRHGEHRGQDLAAGRDATFELEAHANDEVSFRALVDQMKAATVVTDVESPLTFQHHGTTVKRLVCRPRRRSSVQDVGFGLFVARMAVQFHASDPIVYADTASSGSVGFPAASTGRTYARTYPRVYGAAGVGGLVSATNAGDFPVPWVATISGPWTNPTILHVGSGRQLTINVTLASGEVLTVDSAARSILMGGTASRFSSLVQPASWFDLDPGTNEVRFGGASGSGTAVLSWRSGWI